MVFPLAYQDSANKLEENVYYFGRTVETLLLRFGKVPWPLPHLGMAGPPTLGSGRWGVLPSVHLRDQA